MAIAIFPSLEGESLEDVSIKLAEKWRIGQKGLNNGIILVVFAKDRKVRFEVGYGLEPSVPDIVAGQIIREVVAPRFREQRYAEGLSAAIDAVYGRLEGGQAAQPVPRDTRRENQFPMVGFAVVALIIVFVLGSEVFRSRRFTGGHGYTGGGSGWLLPILFLLGGGGRGGDGGGGGGGGGGFSGGGGDFGGGGASGDW